MMIKEGTSGDIMVDNIKAFCCAALFAAAKANIPITSLFCLKPFINHYLKMDLGNAYDLARIYLVGAL